MHTNIWPLTIVYDRYNGTYSGGEWTAWPNYPDAVPEDISSDDVSCDSFWLHADKDSIGLGNTPEEAIRDLECKLTVQETYDNLIQQLKERYDFEATGWDERKRRISFTREIENTCCTHKVDLKDDRNNVDIEDWLIYSYACDEFGKWGDYALELGEYKLFAWIIECLEELYPLTALEKKGKSNGK